MQRQFGILLIVAGLLASSFTGIALAHDDDDDDDDYGETTTTLQVEAPSKSSIEAEYGVTCTKYKNHSGWIPGSYDLAVLYDAGFPVVVHYTDGQGSRVKPPKGSKWDVVYKCKYVETTTTTEPTTTTVPETTTTAPVTTTTEPETTTTTEPETTTTTVPETTTTTEPHVTTTTVPETTTTTSPEVTTTVPETTTTAPETTTTSPVTTTSVPVTTTSEPEVTTTSPPEATTVPPTATVPPTTVPCDPNSGECGELPNTGAGGLALFVLAGLALLLLGASVLRLGLDKRGRR